MCLQTYFSNNFLVKFLDVQDNHEHALLSVIILVEEPGFKNVKNKHLDMSPF